MEGKITVLVGERPSAKVRNIAQANGWGQMFIYCDPKPYSGEPWGFDNGAYLDWRNGRDFDEDRYMRALMVALKVGRPYMAVVPDLVGQGVASLDFSMRWRVALPEWPWYLALQDGMVESHVAPLMEQFDGLFLGGTDRFKGQANKWCAFAHQHGKKFHFARAGTERKIKLAIGIGADSLDSSFPLWSIQRIKRMEYLVNDWRYKEPILTW